MAIARFSDEQDRRTQVLSSLETKAHTRRMYSLDNVFDAEEWQGFLKRLDNAQAGLEHAFWCDPKMDGLALELVYENGRFVEALTRGDGEVGELVTEAMQTVRNLPKVLHGDALSVWKCGGSHFPQKGFRLAQ